MRGTQKMQCSQAQLRNCLGRGIWLSNGRNHTKNIVCLLLMLRSRPRLLGCAMFLTLNLGSSANAWVVAFAIETLTVHSSATPRCYTASRLSSSHLPGATSGSVHGQMGT